MFRITLNRVRDRFLVKEGSESLTMVVDSDAFAIVTRIRNAQEKMIAVCNGEHTEEEQKEAARAFSVSMFGEEQTEKLLAFYNDDYSCVAAICAQYFEKRLTKKIVAAQKKIKK